MRKSIDPTHLWDNAYAALIFFTRLPFWRLYQPPKESYAHVVEYWPLAGWITAAAMAATLYVSSLVMPYPIAVIAAIVVRILVTGALHEDGLCDFFDGFGGGGSDRQRILDIMKDSRIGTYGMLGILLYVMLLFCCLWSLPPEAAAWAILAGDPYAKMVASQIIMMMPYARKEEEAKAKVVYKPISVKAGIILAVQGLLPLAAYLLWSPCAPARWDVTVFAPCLTMYVLYLLIWKRLRGYTGDCCGAIFLLVELTFYLAVVGLTATL